MMWRVINSSKSACLLLTLHSAFFDHYVLYQIKLLNTSVLLKVRAVNDSTIQLACRVDDQACSSISGCGRTIEAALYQRLQTNLPWTNKSRRLGQGSPEVS